MAWEITSTQNEEAWFDDYVRDVLAHEPPPLPPHDQKLGHVETHWHQLEPGVAFVSTNPDTGTADDRRLAEAIITEQLHPHGLKRAVYTFSWDHADFRKVAEWSDIEAKAKRLIQSGNVVLLRNGYNSIIGQVQGDHGNYRTEISRDDPSSQSITGSTCPCGWGEFQNLPRTRQWKRFQDRPCSHILATYWQSMATPIDEERAPGNEGQPGQMALPGMGGPMQAPSTMGIMQQSPAPPPNAWFMPPGGLPTPPGGASPGLAPGMAPGGAQGVTAPSPEEALPQFPMDQSQMPQVGPASIPGGRPGPTPTNPIQYPGGTFSSFLPDRMLHMADQEYQNGDLVQLRHEDMGTLVGRPESGQAGLPTSIPAGSVGEVLGTDPSTQMVNVLFMGKQFDANSFLEPFGTQAWCWPSDLVARPDLRKPGPALRRVR